jgi:carbamoyl-phosphate synthase large subunit
MKRIFVTGGAGVIGLELVPRLIARGFIVMVGDIKPRPTSFSNNVIYRQGDLNNMKESELHAFNPDIIIHLAATFERSEETYSFWQENYNHNVALSHHIISLAKELPTVRRVVFASSYLIYDPKLYLFSLPQSAAVPLTETDAICPRNLTGMAKLAHEMELRFIQRFKTNQLSIVCARIFRGYGCNSRDIISRWVRALLKNESITVYRSEGMFDYIYSADSAEGLIRLAEAEDIPEIVNLGTGRARRVQDVVNILKKHFGGINVFYRESDVPYEASEANMSLYVKYINWLPEHNLESAIPKIIDFERARLHEIDNQPKSVKIRLLVTSAGNKVPLVRAAKNAANRISAESCVIAADKSDKAITKYVADEFWLMPSTVDENLESIVDGCLARGITMVLPTRDGELSFWSRHSNRLINCGITVIVSPLLSVQRCLDKLEFARFGEANGIPVIPAFECSDQINVSKLVVKERFGSGSLGLGLNLDRNQAIEHSRALLSPIYQPFVEGDEFSVDAWVDRNHSVRKMALRWRNDVVNGESRVTTTFSNPRIEVLCKMAIEKLELVGPIVLQGIVDSFGSIQIIECNARFGGASTAGIAVGVDSLYWSMLEALGLEIDSVSMISVTQKMRQIRVPSDMHVYDPDI